MQGAGKAELRARMYSIEEWVVWNRKRGLSPVSTRTFWRGCEVFYRFLERRDSIQNPFRGMKAPAAPAPLPKARTADECRRILMAGNELSVEDRVPTDPCPCDLRRPDLRRASARGKSRACSLPM